MFKFAWPYLLLLLPLPLVLKRFVPKTNSSSQGLKVPFFSELTSLLSTRPPTPRKYWLLWSLWILLVIAVSGPQWVGDPEPLPRQARNLMLALDLSGSMQMKDMLVQNNAMTRLDVVKLAATDFINKRDGDRLGLILFGSRAYLQTPLTFDRKTLLHMLNDATVGLAGQTTAIGDAIGLAIKRLTKTPTKSRVLVLLTDGANNSGVIAPRQAAEMATEKNIKIYTIGLGAESMVVQGFLGPQLYNPSSDLNEPALKEIANLSGGKYFRAKDFKQLEKVYRQIDRLEPVDAKSTVIRPIKEYYFWPLTVAFIIFLSMGLNLRRLHD